MPDSSLPHGLQPTRLLRPWDFPGKSTGVGAIAFSEPWVYRPNHLYLGAFPLSPGAVKCSISLQYLPSNSNFVVNPPSSWVESGLEMLWIFVSKVNLCSHTFFWYLLHCEPPVTGFGLQNSPCLLWMNPIQDHLCYFYSLFCLNLSCFQSFHSLIDWF